MVKNVVENKKKVKEAIKNKHIDYAVDSNWPFMGSFMKFLENLGILSLINEITSTMKRKMISPGMFTLIYIFKIICGIPKIRGSESLLSDLSAMSLLGIKVETLEHGLCQRGDANQHGKGYKKNTPQS